MTFFGGCSLSGSLFAVILLIQASSGVADDNRANKANEKTEFTHDFGLVSAGRVISADMWLDKTLSGFKVERVKASCGCTVADLQMREGRPLLSVRWSLPSEGGDVRKYIELVGRHEADRSGRESSSVYIQLVARARKLIEFEREKVIYEIGDARDLRKPISVLLFNFFERVELRKIELRLPDFKEALVEPDVSVLDKADLPAGAIQGWKLQISESKLIDVNAGSVGSFFVAGNQGSESAEASCSISFRRGSRLSARLVREVEGALQLDVFVKIPPGDWSWEDVKIVGYPGEKPLQYELTKNRDYYGRVRIVAESDVSFPDELELRLVNPKYSSFMKLEVKR